MKILFWINIFSHNTKSKEKQVRRLKTNEINKSLEMLIKREENIFKTAKVIQNNTKKLNLVENQHEVYQCHGRIQGDYPIYIPRNSKLYNMSITIPFMGSYSDNDHGNRLVLDSKTEAVNEKNS